MNASLEWYYHYFSDIEPIPFPPPPPPPAPPLPPHLATSGEDSPDRPPSRKRVSFSSPSGRDSPTPSEESSGHFVRPPTPVPARKRKDDPYDNYELPTAGNKKSVSVSETLVAWLWKLEEAAFHHCAKDTMLTTYTHTQSTQFSIQENNVHCTKLDL